MPQAVLGALKQPLSRLVALSPPPVGLSAGPGPGSRGPATLPPAGSGAQQTATEAPRGQRPGATVRRRAGGRCRSPRGPPAGSTSTSVCTSLESLGQPGPLGSAHPVAPRPPLLLTPASLTAVCRPRPPRGSPSFPRAQTRARPRARGARRPPRWPSPPAAPSSGSCPRSGPLSGAEGGGSALATPPARVPRLSLLRLSHPLRDCDGPPCPRLAPTRQPFPGREAAAVSPPYPNSEPNGFPHVCTVAPLSRRGTPENPAVGSRGGPRVLAAAGAGPRCCPRRPPHGGVTAFARMLSQPPFLFWELEEGALDGAVTWLACTHLPLRGGAVTSSTPPCP